MAGLHTPTLYFLLIALALSASSLLLLAWSQNRAAVALLWWGGAKFLAAFAAMAFAARAAMPELLAVEIGNSALFLSYACSWAGAARFGHAQVRLVALIAGPAIWISLCSVPVFYESAQFRLVVACLIVVGFDVAYAMTLWRGRRERLGSRLALIVLMSFNGVVFALQAPLAVLLGVPQFGDITQTPMMALLLYQAILQIVVSTILQVALVKERAELLQRTAALTDPLTGISNRRGLLELGSACLTRCAAEGLPVSLVFIDIDHFKKVNDTLGHQAGDEVLRQVARTIGEYLRLDDHFGRIGGEEFVCILPNTRVESAMTVAEGLRLRIAALEVLSEGRTVRSAISCGIAENSECGGDLQGLLKLADERCYLAKNAGRNRVVGRSGDIGILKPGKFRSVQSGQVNGEVLAKAKKQTATR